MAKLTAEMKSFLASGRDPLTVLENLKHNPHVCIAAINAKTYKGYQFKGVGEIVDKGGLSRRHKGKIRRPRP